MNEIIESYQMTTKPQINPYSYEELEAKCWRLEHENETLKETIDGLNTELDKLSADYNRLLSELDIINQLEK